MHSFITLTHYNSSHEGGRKRHQYVVGKGQPHTCKEKNTTLKKHQHRIIKHTHDVFSFTLTHYTASHDRWRKRHRYVAGKGLTHTCKEKNKTLKKHQHRIIKLTQNAFFFTLTHYNEGHDRRRKLYQSVTWIGPPNTRKEKKLLKKLQLKKT